MKRIVFYILFLLTLVSTSTFAQDTDEASAATSAFADSLNTMPTENKKQAKNFRNTLKKIIRGFSSVDTNYIEPQHYVMQTMLQGTYTYERYTVGTDNGEEIEFAPEPSLKIGPYIGWKFLFWGYTFDVYHMEEDNRKEYSLDLYSSQIGIDLFYRKTGSNYKIKRMSYDNDKIPEMHNVRFDGFHASIKGFNLYYITNHRKFSYPAAFAQSTVQRRSCGSPMFGIGYMRHTLDIDWKKLSELTTKRMGEDQSMVVDSNIVSGKVKYTDFSLTGGYGYNWVFAKNWLFSGSLSLGLAYKRATADNEHSGFDLKNFRLTNFNLDGVGRFAIVWNTTKWFAGASTVIHTYNYHKQQFSTNSMFGNLKIYIGMNFWRK